MARSDIRSLASVAGLLLASLICLVPVSVSGQQDRMGIGSDNTVNGTEPVRVNQDGCSRGFLDMCDRISPSQDRGDRGGHVDSQGQRARDVQRQATQQLNDTMQGMREASQAALRNTLEDLDQGTDEHSTYEGEHRHAI